MSALAIDNSQCALKCQSPALSFGKMCAVEDICQNHSSNRATLLHDLNVAPFISQVYLCK